MAQEMKYHAWDDYGKKRTKARIRYPWHLWLNGSMWLLVQGEDFDCSIHQFQIYAHGYATNHGIRIKTKRTEDGDGLYIKAYRNSTKEGLRRSRHFRALERRIEEMKQFGDYEWDYPEVDYLDPEEDEDEQ